MPQHVSAYHLTIEPNTYFHRFPPSLPDDDTTSAMQEGIEDALAAAGYDHYEVSAYAKRGGGTDERRQQSDALITHHSSLITARSARCAHNLNYWRFGDYLGIGAGAHSKLSFHDRILRQMRYKQPGQYMESAMAGRAIQQEQQVGPDEVGFEFMMNALRLNEGFATSLFEERAGVPLNTVLPELDRARSPTHCADAARPPLPQ
jgi:oxygen-independent coproporphyrinogen-3 oxidase